MAKKTFEEIKPWDGTSGTGSEARLVIKENFDKVNDMIDDLPAEYVSVSNQELTSEQKEKARENIGAFAAENANILSGNQFSINEKYIAVTTGAESVNVDSSCTPFLEIDINSPIKVKGRGNDTVALIAFYDVNKVYISSIHGAEYNNVLTTIPVESIPANTAYIRATCTTVNGGELYAGFILGISKNIQRNITRITEVELNAIKDISGNPFIEKGKYINISNGSLSSGSGIDTTPLMLFNREYPVKIFGRGSTGSALMAFYDANKVYISSIYGAEYNNVLTTIPVESIPATAKYIRASCNSANGGILTIGFTSSIANKLSDIELSISDTKKDLSGNQFSITGKYIAVTTGAESVNVDSSCTPFLEIDINSPIKVKGRGNDTVALIAFYDVNKVYISSIHGAEYNNVLTTIPVESIPANTAYIRATCTTVNGGELYAGFVLGISKNIQRNITKTAEVELNSIKDISGNPFTEKGKYINISNGAISSNSAIDTTPLMLFNREYPVKVLGRGSTGSALIAFYDVNKVYISSIYGAEYNNVLTTIPVESIPATAKYIRASCNSANGGILTIGFTSSIANKLSDIELSISDTKKDLSGNQFSITGKYIAVTTGAESVNVDSSCTPFLEIDINSPIKVKGRGNDTVALIAFYDVNKVYISSIYGAEYNNVLTTIPVESIPANTVYIRATCTTVLGGELDFRLSKSLLQEVSDIKNNQYYINVTKKYPVEGYHTRQSARTTIPAIHRISGLVIAYQTGLNQWTKEIFIGSNVNEWVRDIYWQKLNKEDVTEHTTELQGDEMVLSGIQDGKEKLMPIKQLQDFFINSQNGFPQPENTLFYPSHIDLINNKWVDKSGNQNDADLVQSNCGTAKVGTIMTFNEPLEGNLGDWVLTHDGTSTPVLAIDKITFSGAGTIFNLRLVNETLNKHHYYPISEGTIAVYDCSGNSKHITVTGSTVQEWIANKQDEFHYNLKKGGSVVDNSGLVNNPTMTGIYVGGIAPGYALYNAISASEETEITIHGQAQRVVTSVIGGSLTYSGLKRKYKVGDVIKTTISVYVISGKVNGYAIASTDLKSVNIFESQKTNQWEDVESYVLVASDIQATHLLYIRAAAVNSEWIVGEVKTEVISNEVIVPSLENSPYDALGNALDVMPKSIFKVETAVKFPNNAELIEADVENYLFDESQLAKSIKLSSSQFALKNMVYDNRLFFNSDTSQMFIFRQNLDSKNLKGLLNKFAKPSIHIYRLPEEYSIIGKERIDVRDVNRNFRVGINQSGLLCVSNDYGKTWSAGVNYSPSGGIHHIFITSKGAVVIFYHKSVIKRMGWGENTFTSIYPVDENGDPIEMHSPVNVLWPGEYYKPYHKLLDLYDPSDNTSLIAWGTWNNNAGSNGAAPQALWYSIDDMVTIKRFYYFGQNPQYTDLGTSTAGPGGTLLGDPTNPIICRHTHEFSYNKYDGKIYITCGDSHIRPELHIFETKYNKSTDTWDELVDLVDNENRSQIHRAIGIGFDKDGYFYFGSDADFVPHTHNGVEYDVQGMFKVHKDDINDISKYKLLHPAKDIVVNSYMIDDIILFSVSGQTNLVHISLDKGKSWQIIDFEPYMRETYPFDKRVITSRTVASFKIDSQKNIHVNCGTGVYVNISIK